MKRKEEDENFEEKRLNLTIVEKEAESECPPVRREPWRHTLDRDNQGTPRQRPPDQRSDVYDRRFNRGRLSPTRRHVSYYSLLLEFLRLACGDMKVSIVF